jgi:hypothetical protein
MTKLLTLASAVAFSLFEKLLSQPVKASELFI